MVGQRLSQERYLWSVIPCLLVWPTLLMPLTQAAGVQVGAAPLGAAQGCLAAWEVATRNVCAPKAVLSFNVMTMRSV